jgi:hypothetical protein
MTAAPQPRSYKDSLAYKRSNRLRADGSPVWPLRPSDNPSNYGLVR